jgi:hypothetical protein
MWHDARKETPADAGVDDERRQQQDEGIERRGLTDEDVKKHDPGSVSGGNDAVNGNGCRGSGRDKAGGTHGA